MDACAPTMAGTRKTTTTSPNENSIDENSAKSVADAAPDTTVPVPSRLTRRASNKPPRVVRLTLSVGNSDDTAGVAAASRVIEAELDAGDGEDDNEERTVTTTAVEPKCASQPPAPVNKTFATFATARSLDPLGLP
ncbi:unnamed protein product, partial [Ectocarpus sp. 12 AP-2014]